MNIGFDAKRIVRNNTGLGSYGRTLVNDLAEIVPPDTRLCLYAPDEGHEALRQQITMRPSIQFCYPQGRQPKWWWRSRGIVDDFETRPHTAVSRTVRRTAHRHRPVGHQERGDHPRPHLPAPSRILQMVRQKSLRMEVPQDHTGGRPHCGHQRVHQARHHASGQCPRRED